MSSTAAEPARRRRWAVARCPASPVRVVLSAAVLLAAACGPTWDRPSLHPPGEIPAEVGDAGYLKAHLTSGDVVIFGTWSPELVPDSGLVGVAVRFDPSREPVDGPRRMNVSLSDIAVLESADRETVSRLSTFGLATLTGIWGVTTAVCLADPKSCFGSCPTFYLEDEVDGAPVAEGFSSSFAKALEETDVDWLRTARPGGERFSVLMRNEAQETHAVRWVRLLAVPTGGDGRPLRTIDNAFHAATTWALPTRCRAGGESSLRHMRDLDGSEWAPAADSSDLAARQVTELAFPSVSGSAAVVLSARQAFVSTFVFYQGLAYTGRRMGDWLARLESGDPTVRDRVLSPARALGGIQIEVAEGNGDWRTVGTFDEAGPIANDLVAFPFEAHGSADPLRVRLRSARGSWRIDQVAVVGLGPRLEPVRLEPVGIRPEAALMEPEAAGAFLQDPDRYLITLRGDAYWLDFELPPMGRFELFLESRGYYYEWMREEWLADEDPAAAALLMTAPETALRRLAPAFKALEPHMESAFWNSRFRRRVDP